LLGSAILIALLGLALLWPPLRNGLELAPVSPTALAGAFVSGGLIVGWQMIPGIRHG
jgi:hypothetical protein